MQRVQKLINSVLQSAQKTRLFYLVPVIIVSIALGNVIIQGGLGYDDSYNLQVSQHLASSGAYATNGAVFFGKPIVFDYHITTGPTLLIPVAVAIKIFGPTVFASRLVPVMILIIFCITAFLYIQRMARGLKISLKDIYATYFVFLALFIGIGSVDNLLFSVMGEILSLVFILWSFLQLDNRKYFSSGLLLGLGIATKLLSALVLPVVLFYLLIKRGSWANKIRNSLSFLISMLFPLLLEEIYRFIALGGRSTAYIDNIKDSYAFFKEAGSGITEARSTILGLFIERIHSIINGVSIFHFYFYIPLILLVATTLIYLVSQRITLRKLQLLFNKDVPLRLLLYSGTLWLSWWLFASTHTFTRHIFGALVLLSLAITYFILFLREKFTLTRHFPLILLVLSLLTIVLNCTFYNYQFGTIRTQKDDAAKIARYYKGNPLYHYGWWQNPEIQYINQVSSLPASLTKPGTNILINRLQQELDPSGYSNLLSRCERTVKLSQTYEICVEK